MDSYEFEIIDGPHAGRVISAPAYIMDITLCGKDADGSPCHAEYAIRFLPAASGRHALGLVKLTTKQPDGSLRVTRTAPDASAA